MHPDPDLQPLMERYQAGDFTAAAALVDRLSPQLHRYFRVQVSSRAHADDLLQETWLRIHQARHTYLPGEPVLPWFYTIARLIRIDHFRRMLRTTWREQPLERSYDVPQIAHDPRDTPGLDELLAPLPESQRDVIAMLKVSGMSIEEVAMATSSSIGSVKQKAHRAYDTMRKAFAGLRSTGRGGAGGAA
jgi:RNA polymerase sigma-70 factor (ECF subfamily)